MVSPLRWPHRSMSVVLLDSTTRSIDIPVFVYSRSIVLMFCILTLRASTSTYLSLEVLLPTTESVKIVLRCCEPLDRFAAQLCWPTLIASHCIRWSDPQGPRLLTEFRGACVSGCCVVRLCRWLRPPPISKGGVVGRRPILK